jgi:sulfur relay (sulfurtransferase) complex TusBCD TusD component (DsrE family)
MKGGAMKRSRFVTFLFVACAVAGGDLAFAGDKDPLFVSMTTDDAYRSVLAIKVSKNMLERGHPLTIFFNDRGILVTSKGNGDKFKEQQEALAELAKAGATLIACPICMKHYGIKESDLLEGIKVGNPQLTGDALFRDNTKTLSW